MDDGVETNGGGDAGGPDLAILERIEGELFAVERALEQIDQGVYEGFAGLDDAPAPHS
jgi:hypothetical protein